MCMTRAKNWFSLVIYFWSAKGGDLLGYCAQGETVILVTVNPLIKQN